jgi:hypothetical protein
MTTVWIILYGHKIQAVRTSETKAKDFIEFQRREQPEKVDLWFYEAWMVE